jgi:hypothetical protein
MAVLDFIDIGSAPNDGTGDPLRDAFNKSNQNDQALNDDIGTNTNAITALQTGKANRANPSTAGNIAELDAGGNVVDSGSATSDVLINPVNEIVLNTSYTPSGSVEGRITWNGDEYTINVETGLGPVIQVGQETLILIYNDTGTIITNFTALRPFAATTVEGIIVPTVERAKSDVFSTVEGTIMVATMDIGIGQIGFATRFGRARGGNTTLFTPGAALYIDPVTPGLLTETRPEFPNYIISVGGALNSAAAPDGEIFVSITRDIFDTITNFWNGVFRETFSFTVDSDGAIVTGTLTPTNGNVDMTMIFSTGLALLDTSPPATIALTPGTDTIPQENFIYVLESTKALTVSTSDWPTTQHIKVATVVLKSASATQLNGALKNHNWNDHIQSSSDDMGHLAHITEKLRQFEAQWDSGAEGSVTIDATPSPDDVFVKVTSGVVYQVHKQIFPLLDMTQYTIDAVSTGSGTFTISDDGDLSSTFPDGRRIQVNGSTGNDGIFTIASTNYSAPNFVITVNETISDATADGTIGDDIVVINDFTTPYKSTLNINTETVDALGVTLANSSFSFVVWGVQSSAGDISHLMLNKPIGKYSRLSPENAVSDALNYSVYEIPKIFQGSGFLIARFTFTLQNDGVTWALYDTEDLRGRIPNSTAGGGGGGTGVTTYTALTDTPSSYAGQAGKFFKVNAAETSQEFSGLTEQGDQVVPGSHTQTFSATPTFDFDNGNVQQITLTGNITSWGISNDLPAGSYTIFFIQDATGGRTIADPTGPTETDNSIVNFVTTANAVNIVNIFVTPAGTSYWSLVETITP